jgi:hypothetical protein
MSVGTANPILRVGARAPATPPITAAPGLPLVLQFPGRQVSQRSGDVGSIITLALAAALYPQLLAVVVIILTRPNPQPLLWACYLSSLFVSIGSSVLIFAVFQSRGSVAGTSSQRLGPAAYLTFGTVAVFVAIVIATRRGRVSRFSDWMQTNKRVAVGAIVGLFGIVLIGRGISGLG